MTIIDSRTGKVWKVEMVDEVPTESWASDQDAAYQPGEWELEQERQDNLVEQDRERGIRSRSRQEGSFRA